MKPPPPKVRESKKPAPPVIITPRTIDDGFALVDGHLMRRSVALVGVVNWGTRMLSREVEHLTPCGDRVRFGGRTYRAAVVAHYLMTGDLSSGVPRPAKRPRYKAQIRVGARVVHLGYFATADERDAAVFFYRLGVFPNDPK